MFYCSCSQKVVGSSQHWFCFRFLSCLINWVFQVVNRCTNEWFVHLMLSRRLNWRISSSLLSAGVENEWRDYFSTPPPSLPTLPHHVTMSLSRSCWVSTSVWRPRRTSKPRAPSSCSPRLRRGSPSAGCDSHQWREESCSHPNSIQSHRVLKSNPPTRLSSSGHSLLHFALGKWIKCRRLSFVFFVLSRRQVATTRGGCIAHPAAHLNVPRSVLPACSVPACFTCPTGGSSSLILYFCLYAAN